MEIKLAGLFSFQINNLHDIGVYTLEYGHMRNISYD